jgi:hypothetical protein
MTGDGDAAQGGGVVRHRGKRDAEAHASHYQDRARSEERLELRQRRDAQMQGTHTSPPQNPEVDGRANVLCDRCGHCSTQDPPLSSPTAHSVIQEGWGVSNTSREEH